MWYNCECLLFAVQMQIKILLRHQFGNQISFAMFVFIHDSVHFNEYFFIIGEACKCLKMHLKLLNVRCLLVVYCFIDVFLLTFTCISPCTQVFLETIHASVYNQNHSLEYYNITQNITIQLRLLQYSLEYYNIAVSLISFQVY